MSEMEAVVALSPGGELEVLTAREVAALLKVNEATVYRLLRKGELPALRIGRVVRVSKQALEEFLRTSSGGQHD